MWFYVTWQKCSGLLHQLLRIAQSLSVLTMQTVHSFMPLVGVYQTTPSHIPAHSTLINHLNHCYRRPNWQITALSLSLLASKMFTVAFKQSYCSSYTYERSGRMYEYVSVRFARQSWGRQEETRRCFLGGELKLKHHNNKLNGGGLSKLLWKLKIHHQKYKSLTPIVTQLYSAHFSQLPSNITFLHTVHLVSSLSHCCLSKIPHYTWQVEECYGVSAAQVKSP
jgi:hypothetical protein